MNDSNHSVSTPTRRTVLKVAGAAGITGLAGCTGTTGSSSSGSGTPTVTYGILNPLTGPFGALAEDQRKGAKIAVKHINESDLDVQINPVYDDTEGKPSVGRRKAQRLIEQEDASYLMGAISSSTALALTGFAKEQEVLYNPGGAAIPITGEKCNEYIFRAETTTAQIAAAVSDFLVDNLGQKIWFHVADYAYGDSVQKRIGERIESAADVEIAGTSRSKVGASNFSSYISQIANSDAEVVVLGMTGGDLIKFVKQADSQGLKEQVDLMAPTMSLNVVRNALGEAAYGTYGGVRYVPSLDTGNNSEFVEAFRAEYDADPGSFARTGYQSLQMTAQGIAEAGSTDVEEVISVLPGLEVESIYGQNRFRECDHQAVNPAWAGKLVEPSEGTAADVELLNEVSGEEATTPCEDVRCSL